MRVSVVRGVYVDVDVVVGGSVNAVGCVCIYVYADVYICFNVGM